MAAVLVVLLGPIVKRGAEAFVFRGTVEHRRFLSEKFERGSAERLDADQEGWRVGAWQDQIRVILGHALEANESTKSSATSERPS